MKSQRVAQMLTLSTLLWQSFVVYAGQDGPSGSGASGPRSLHKSDRKSDELPTFVPRFTLVEANYPQIVAASGGVWMLVLPGQTYQAGPVADLQIGLSGARLALGFGASSALLTSYEHVSSFGVQGVVHRSWPGWDALLPTSATFAGVEVFGHFFAFRCSLGLMWNVSGGETKSSPHPTGGCGLGLP